MTTTLTLPYSRPPITSNEAARSNGRAHASTRRQMRSTAAVIAKAEKLGQHPRSDVMCTWWVPDLIHRDAGSLSALLKASIDGLVDAGVWPDDWFAYVRTESCRIELDRTNPRIELSITPIWEPNPMHPHEVQMQPGGTTR